MYDVVIIGGGINGAGIARDAAMRGLSVALLERRDFAIGTSSISTKLIHGGLRYLEQGHFHLVKESLKERETLLRIANSIVRPLPFFMPDSPNLRSPLKMRLGFWLYDFLFPSQLLPRSSRIKLDSTHTGLKGDSKKGFWYYDAKVDDARLVMLNCIDAARHGASLHNDHELIKAQAIPEGFELTVQDHQRSVQKIIHTKTIVNATGPSVNEVLEKRLGLKSRYSITWVKGSHLVLSGLPTVSHAFTLQIDDRRIVFVIPWGECLSLVGTTEQHYTGDVFNVSIDENERSYLLDCVNQFFKIHCRPENIQDEFSGIRPLFGSPLHNLSKQSREYAIDVQNTPLGGTILSLYGGKLTTYRALSERVVDQILQILKKPASPCMTAHRLLPGAFQESRKQAWQTIQLQYPWVEKNLLHSWFEHYGLLVHEFLSHCSAMQDLGKPISSTFYTQEESYLQQKEWMNVPEDIIRRRSDIKNLFSQH